MKYRGTKLAFHDVRHLHNDEELTVEGGKGNRAIRKEIKEDYGGQFARKIMRKYRRGDIVEGSKEHQIITGYLGDPRKKDPISYGKAHEGKIMQEGSYAYKQQKAKESEAIATKENEEDND